MSQVARYASLTLAFSLIGCLAAGGAFAQGTLRIGLGDDPDALDPTTSRTYTARIVFASLCDKLFDIDEKLSVVPQLALGHETSADGKTVTIKLNLKAPFSPLLAQLTDRAGMMVSPKAAEAAGDPDGNSVIYQTCGAPQNMGHYCDKEVDAWHHEARIATDPAARKAAYAKIAAKFLADGWIVYLFHPQILIAYTDRLEGFTQMPDGLVRVIGLKLK